jgi:ethylmalonyl-CoA/methylmalonyl-CoA decarboxylase
VSWDPARFPRGRGEVQLHIDGRVAVLCLNNPEARNAMSVGMMADLCAAVDRLEQSEVSAVLIHGVSPAGFCAGGDLRDVRAHLLDASSAEGMPLVMGDALDRLSAMNAVIVAAVEGAALGGGAELLTAADWVVAGESARVGFVHAALGVSPGWGGARRLIRRVGHRTALPLLVQASRLRAQQAQQIGLIDEVVADGATVQSAHEWIARVTRHPTASIQGALQILRSARDDGDGVARVEREVFARLWGADAHQRALDNVKAGG